MDCEVTSSRQAAGAGFGCNNLERSVDCVIGIGDSAGLQYSSSLESAWQSSERVMAALLGSAASSLTGESARGLVCAGDGGSWTVCILALLQHPGVWVASLFTHQSGGQSASCGSARV